MISVLIFLLSQVATLGIALAAHPYVAFVGYQIIYFMYHDSRWWYLMVPGLSYSFVCSATLLLLAFTKRGKNPNQIRKVPAFMWMYALLAFYALTYFWASNTDLHVFSLDDYVKTIVVISAAYVLCTSEKALNVYLWGYVATAAYIGYYALEIGRTSAGRFDLIGTVDAPEVNAIAAATAPAAVLALHMFWTAKHHAQRAVSVVLGALLVNGLVLMNSRGAFLGVAVGAATYVFFLLRTPFPEPGLRAKAIGVGFAGLLSLAAVLDSSAIGRFQSIFDETALTEERETGATRLYFWRAAYDMSFDYPLGKGYRGFFFEGLDYMPRGIAGGGRRRAVHSTWFEILTEAGYPGLFFFCMMLWTSWKQLNAVKKTAVSLGAPEHYYLGCVLQASLLSFMVCMSFIDRMRAEVLYWLVLFSACAYAVVVLQKTSKDREPQQSRVTQPLAFDEK